MGIRGLDAQSISSVVFRLRYPLYVSLFISRTKCSKGGRICNALSREGVRYV